MSDKTGTIVTIFGGTGFIGRHIVRRLAREGYTVKVATRAPESAYFLKPYGKVAQIVPVACNCNDQRSIAAAVDGARIVINCIGILHARKKHGFFKAHVETAQSIAAAAAKAGADRLVHISALGIDQARSRYAESKREGEAAVRAAFPAATILRPSVVFGPEDRFFNMFARLAQLLPALPLIGGGKTKLQPVYVADVADAVMTAIARPATAGRTYELGGPDIVTFRDIYNDLARYTGKKRLLVPVPFWSASIDARFLALLPNPVLTPDQVVTLKTDNIVSPGALTLVDLGIAPTGMTLVVPHYLEHFRPGGRFSAHKPV